MWLRQKHSGRWTYWEWDPGMDLSRLLAVREAVRAAYAEYVSECLRRGEQLIVVAARPRIETPLGFTANDFVRRVVEALPWRGQLTVDFFNVRHFFQTIQVAGGDYESGPKTPFRRLGNVLAKKPA